MSTDDYTGANSGLFDSTGSTTTPIDTSNLFDTSLTNTEASQAGTTTTAADAASATTTTPICVDPNQSVLGSSTGTSTSNALPSACYTSGYYLPQNSLYSIGYQSYGSMDYCFRLVMSYGQQSCGGYHTMQSPTTTTTTSFAAPNYAALFQSAQMALVRCYRQVLAQQMMAAQWAPDQGQSFEGNEMMMMFLFNKILGGND
jgi:hypothetical protein